jgi:hypothetical protein
MLGTREPARLAAWVAQDQKARVGTFAEAAAFGWAVCTPDRRPTRGRSATHMGHSP